MKKREMRPYPVRDARQPRVGHATPRHLRDSGVRTLGNFAII